MVFCISVVSVVTSPFSFLILFIWVFFSPLLGESNHRFVHFVYIFKELALDSPGFIANRILMPYINEAIIALETGVGDKESIDAIMKNGTGVPMGPLQLADFIGLDTCLSIMEVLHTGLGDSKYRPAVRLRQMVDAGWFGKKSGKGFYEY